MKRRAMKRRHSFMMRRMNRLFYVRTMGSHHRWIMEAVYTNIRDELLEQA